VNFRYIDQQLRKSGKIFFKYVVLFFCSFRSFFVDEKEFYVCSYGGSGSWMLVNILKKYGRAYHIHSRNPPVSLTFPDGESFGRVRNYNKKAKVIFIYSYPEHSLNSSNSFSKEHWVNIGVGNVDICPSNLKEYYLMKKDYINYEGFFDNYYYGKKSYNIIFVNYHKLWECQEEFFKLLNIVDQLPKKKEKKTYALMDVYDDFRKRIDGMFAVFIQ